MKLSNRAMAGWAITVFLLIGLLLLVIALVIGNDTDSQEEQPVQGRSVVR
jgi:hypothetical protein